MAEEIKSMGIVVDDGSQRVPIMNQHGDEIGVFYFHPTDIGIIQRYNEISNSFDEIVEPLTSVNIAPDGTVDGDDAVQVEALEEAEKRLYKAVNKLFGGDMASAFFGSMHPFSPVNGSFYCEKALEAVGKYISEQFEQETAKYSKRIEKYTKGYQK